MALRADAGGERAEVGSPGAGQGGVEAVIRRRLIERVDTLPVEGMASVDAARRARTLEQLSVQSCGG